MEPSSPSKKFICHFYQESECNKTAGECKCEHVEPKGFGVCLVDYCLVCKLMFSFMNPKNKDNDAHTFMQ
jgi:hypothetical protein